MKGDCNMKKWRIFSIIFAMVAVGCLALIVSILTSDGGDVSQFRKKDNNNTKSVKNPIDWKRLQKKNPNIYAWVEVPGTSINYPVLQSASNQEEDFYLRHNIEDKYEFAGSIYSQKKNKKDFQDPVTVLYGHNMLNGSMFSGIRKFENRDFFKKHDTFYIYLPREILTYQIVSYYVTDSHHLLDTYHPEQEKGFNKYLQDIMAGNNGNVRNARKLMLEDHIVTLSTCSSIGNSRRLLQGVRVKEQVTE